MDAKRGFVPEDVKNFSPEALEKMRTASRHVCYLANEGYDLKQATTFVGNHYLLSDHPGSPAERFHPLFLYGRDNPGSGGAPRHL